MRAHPLALQSAQLQHLIAEASAAQQGSEDANPPAQVHLLHAACWQTLRCQPAAIATPTFNTTGYVSMSALQLEFKLQSTCHRHFVIVNSMCAMS